MVEAPASVGGARELPAGLLAGLLPPAALLCRCNSREHARGLFASVGGLCRLGGKARQLPGERAALEGLLAAGGGQVKASFPERARCVSLTL
jgi:hypothetical protein